MTLAKFTLPAALFATLFVTGCASHTYYAVAPPPPPGYGAPPLIERADGEGFRMGSSDGARDAYNGRGYHPKSDRKYKETPGYDAALGPYGPYRDRFRDAYLRGYDRGYNHV
jgi:hypothetical protein